MARAPLLQLSQIRLGYGGDPVFDDLNLIIHPRDHLALVGRNGSGKSTLMKMMSAMTQPDSGSIAISPGVSVRYLEQEPEFSGFSTLGDFAAARLGSGEIYRVEKIGLGLDLDLSLDCRRASGGERRRAALARLLAEEADLMLLDEPTNHLDISAILWLEERLKNTRAAFVLVSHDRAFLSALTRATIWLDRGVARRQDKGFDAFEPWRDSVWQHEDSGRHKLDRKLADEGRWAVEGISARRKRNQGRLRALAALRQTRANAVPRQGAPDLAVQSGTRSGKLVIEAVGLAKQFDNRPIVRDFSIKIARGERIAVVGPNGVGKTTLVAMLTGAQQPDHGSVKHGSNLTVAQLDQNRDALMPDLSLIDNLSADADMRVSGKADQIMVRGQPRHVLGYLNDFLFDAARARAPVRSLSGGEKARLLLARIMARQSNLLVLDEPTNDLDIETLDLLQDVLSDYSGTVLMISHDRDFIDRLATRTIAMEGDGVAEIYAGGWSDYRLQRREPETPKATAKRTQTELPKTTIKPKRSGLTFTQKHRLAALPDRIEQLEADVARLNALLSDAELFTGDRARFDQASAALIKQQSALVDAENEWVMLEDLAGRA